MSWKSFKSKSAKSRRGGRAYVRLVGNGKNKRFYLNPEFIERFDVKNNLWAEMLYNEEDKEIGIRFHPSQLEYYYYKITLSKKSRGETYWAWLGCRAFLDWIDADIKKGTTFFPEEKDGIIVLFLKAETEV